MKVGSVPKLPRRKRAQAGTGRSVTANSMVAQTTAAATISRWMLAALAEKLKTQRQHQRIWMSVCSEFSDCKLPRFHV